MAAAANIVIADGQSTPVNHTFVPSQKEGSTVIYQERSTAHTEAGFYALSVGSTVSAKSPVRRVKISLSVPLEVLNTVTGGYSYDNTMRANIELLIPTAAIQGNRADLAAYVKNFTALTLFTDIVKSLDFPY